MCKPENEFKLRGPPELERQAFSKTKALWASQRTGTETTSPRTRDTPDHLPHCLKLFYQVDPSQLQIDVRNAWQEDPPTALKVIFHLRVRGTGHASDKEFFYDACCWLFEHHPQTLIANVANIARLGYLKDLLEILARILEGGGLSPRRLVSRTKQGKKAKVRARRERMYIKPYRYKVDVDLVTLARTRKRPAEIRIQDSNARDQERKQKAAAARRKWRYRMAHEAVFRHRNDPSFRSFYDSVADLFSEMLSRDMKALEMKEELSLAAKWCPSLDSSYDKQTLVCEAIACRLFPKDSDSEYEQLEDEHYVYRVRDRLRKEVLVPLRKALEIPEVLMTAQRWNELAYEKVGWTAMRNYAKLFRRHDQERFEVYSKGMAEFVETAVEEMLPHEILARAVQNFDEGLAEEAEVQWEKTLELLKNEKSNLTSCLTLCCLNNDRKGPLMELSAALGLLTSELNDEPWNRLVGTFCEDPKLLTVHGESLKEKYAFLRLRYKRGSIINFDKLFDRILARARMFRVPSDKMLRQVLILGNVEFLSCLSGQEEAWTAMYVNFCKKFQAAGFQKPPQLIFWNFRAVRRIPEVTQRPGLVLVSCYSKKLVKILLECGRLDPMVVMNNGISSHAHVLPIEG